MASTRRRRKRCRFCGELFLADPRLRSRQVACSKAECRRARKQASQRRWVQRNAEYFKGRYYNTKKWLEAHPDYLAEYRRRHRDKAQRDAALRKERHELDKKARADIQDAISLQETIAKRVTPTLTASLGADIQDAFWPQVVAVSVFSSSFAASLRRRYTRRDRPQNATQVASGP